MDLFVLLGIIALGFICEYIDSSLGMGYGTILSPLLINLGFPALAVVPSILVSQAAGGFFASIFHHKNGNVCFRKKSDDSKIVYIITIAGIAATIIAALIATKLPKNILNLYIGVMVLIIGLIMLSKHVFKFSWKKIIGVGVVSSFNKGMSGGGFGPVVTGGQIIAGKKHKNAIGCTTLAEAPICIAGFLTYVLIRGLPQANLFVPLLIGSIAATPFGPKLTSKLRAEKLRWILGISIVVLGAWILVKLVI